MSELTLTISPALEQDFLYDDFVQSIVKDDEPFLIAKHSDSGHVNFHIYFRLKNKTRTDNFRRKFLKFITGDSITHFAIKVTNAYSLQSFITYVFHEEGVQLLLRYKIEDTEIVNCIKNKTVVSQSKYSNKVLTLKNASKIINDFCTTNDIKPYDYIGSRQLVRLMLNAGYTFAPIRGKLTAVMAEVKFLLSGDDKYIYELIMEIQSTEKANPSYL